MSFGAGFVTLTGRILLWLHVPANVAWVKVTATSAKAVERASVFILNPLIFTVFFELSGNVT